MRLRRELQRLIFPFRTGTSAPRGIAAAARPRFQMESGPATSASAGPGAPPPSPFGPRPSGPPQPAKPQTVVRQGDKVGRNDPCPCGSGKKYKKCHGATSQVAT